MKKRRKLGPKSLPPPKTNKKEADDDVTGVLDTPNTVDLHPPDQGDPNNVGADLHPPDQRKVLSSRHYNENLLKYLNDDRQRPGSFCDLVVVVEGKEFRAHKVVVAVGSSYFYASLIKNPDAEVVMLEHVSSAVFQHLLNFLYTSEFFVSEKEINIVLEAAKFLDIIDAVNLLGPEDERIAIKPLTPEVERSSPVKLLTPEVERSSLVRPLTSEDDHSSPVKLLTPEHERISPGKLLTPEDECSSSVKPLSPDDEHSSLVKSLAPEDELSSLVKPLAPEDEPTLPVKPLSPDSEHSPPVKPLAPEDERSPVKPLAANDECSSSVKPLSPDNEHSSPVKPLAPEDERLSPVKNTSHPEVTQEPAKLENKHKCPLCDRTFRYRKTLENHMDRAHPWLKAGSKDPDSSTRKSARKRKCPAKFGEQDDVESDSSISTASYKIIQVASYSEDSNAMNDEVEEVEEGDTSVQEENDEEVSEVHPEEPGEDLVKPEEKTDNRSSLGDFPEGLAPILSEIRCKKILKCPLCDKSFDRIGKYVSHTRVHTGEKPFECDICYVRCSTKSNLTVHRKKHSNEADLPKKEHKCPFCNRLHASRKTLVKHVKRFHAENAEDFLTIKRIKTEGWNCDICNKSFTRRPHLQEHMILHSQDKPFKCTYCDEQFKSRFKRLRHQEKYHLGPFPCDICGRQFNDTGNLKRHIEYTHGGKRKWICFICGKSVRERTTLEEHLRIHSGEKPHLCSICGQSFRHGSSYRLHLRVHHDDKRYECDECGKTFIRHDHLTKHKKIHSGERAHQCEECGKCFGRRDHLTVHYKSVHLGEKIWQKYKTKYHQCEVCKKVFKGKSSLEMHFRTHSGEKPYKCPICNQSFRIKKTLTKHLVIHSDARPYNCQHCSASFKRKDKLKYHTDHVHGCKTEEEEGAREEAKTYPDPSHSSDAEICVPITLVPVEMGENEAEVETHAESSVMAQPADLAFLEKYTLNPQPATLLHPVRPEQIVESRDQSYLGTLLGLDSQSVSSTEHQ
ncbi:hypothetical protein GDO78_009301 [Eleutherodactylus coqui]|uniref:Zinc finger and BTB domain-containing protein 41 n=1 Tax=Eleutherodactylus coqui TaxID=57060 RepID=A0A8J6FAN5_ELECQ|nr:hypothetical protein GDO78_009301 [Eleutherodactylus coqui]